MEHRPMRLVPALFAAAIVPLTGAPAQAPAAPPAKVASANDDNRIICKKFPVTGSLVQSTRVCKEKHYWDLEYAVRRQNTVTSSCGAEGGVCSENDSFAQMGTGH